MSWPWISSFLILKQYIPVPLIFKWHVQDLGFENLFLHTRRVSDKCLPVPYYSCIPAFFKLVFPSFAWYSSFFCRLFWNYLILYSFSMTKTFSRTDTAKFYLSSPSNMSFSPSLFLFSRVTFLQVNMIFLSLPFNYSECVGFFHGHYPSMTYKSVWVLLVLYIILFCVSGQEF